MRLLEHAGLKALSLGLAVLLWIVVAGEENVERGLRVPLELQQFPLAAPRNRACSPASARLSPKRTRGYSPALEATMTPKEAVS